MTEFFDPSAMNPQSTTILWEGTSNSASNIMSAGRVANASYVVTEDAIKFARGMLSTHEEYLPLIIVRDADLRQSISQRARGVGDLTLKVDPQAAAQYGQSAVALVSIKEPQMVRDLILRQANTVRAYWTNLNLERQVGLNRARANQTVVAPAQPAQQAGVGSAATLDAASDFMAQLTKLGEMKTAGLLTDDEFAAAKARLLTPSGMPGL